MKKVVIIIGATGTGKSSLGNSIQGCIQKNHRLYPVTHGTKSGTNELTVNDVEWAPETGDNEEFCLIDCPGL